MATAMFDASDTGSAARAPIRRHPLFPAVVALWFALLLGLGTLVLPGASLERVLGGAGLATWAPATEIDTVTRLAIAAVAGTIGAVLGWLLARQLARAFAAVDRELRAMPASRRPISAHEELGDAGLGPRADPRPELRLVLNVAPAAPEPLELTEFMAEDMPAFAAEAEEPVQARLTEPFAAPRLVPAPEPAPPADWAVAPLDTLDTGQLVQRLGASLDKRRLSAISPLYAPADPFPAPAARPFDPPAPDGHYDPMPHYDTPADVDQALRRALNTLQRMTAGR